MVKEEFDLTEEEQFNAIMESIQEIKQIVREIHELFDKPNQKKIEGK